MSSKGWRCKTLVEAISLHLVSEKILLHPQYLDGSTLKGIMAINKITRKALAEETHIYTLDNPKFIHGDGTPTAFVCCVDVQPSLETWAPSDLNVVPCDICSDGDLLLKSWLSTAENQICNMHFFLFCRHQDAGIGALRRSASRN